MNAKLKVLACMLLTLGCATSASAATSVSGAIAGETWTKLNSPYLVVGNVSVAALTIQPGVTIMFMGNYGFEIAGGISAIGTGADPIIFTRTNAVGGWQGIFFNENPFASELAKAGVKVFL